MTDYDDRVAQLPLAQLELLSRAIGCRLVDITRDSATSVESFVARGKPEAEYFARISGATQLIFTGGLIHALDSWPGQLSLTVEEGPLDEDEFPYDARRYLSETAAVPHWLRDLVGRTVRGVWVHVYQDDVPSAEPRQAAVSYEFDNGEELYYATHIHGRMSGDELIQRREVIPSTIARSVSVLMPDQRR